MWRISHTSATLFHMSPEPDDLVLQRLRAVREEMATKADLADVGSNLANLKLKLTFLRADVASD